MNFIICQSTKRLFSVMSKVGLAVRSGKEFISIIDQEGMVKESMLGHKCNGRYPYIITLPKKKKDHFVEFLMKIGDATQSTFLYIENSFKQKGYQVPYAENNLVELRVGVNKGKGFISLERGPETSLIHQAGRISIKNSQINPL